MSPELPRKRRRTTKRQELMAESSPTTKSPANELEQRSNSRELSRRLPRDTTSAYLDQLFSNASHSPLSAALVPWLAGDLSAKTRRDYLESLRQFAGAMADQGIPLLKVTAAHVRMYKAARLAAGKRPATVCLSLSAIRGMYRQLGQAHLVPWNVVADIQNVRSPRVEKNQTPGLTYEQSCALLNAPDCSTPIGLRDHAMLYAFFYTALRVSAVASAKVGGLRQIDGVWHLNVTEKRSKERELELRDATPAVIRWLQSSGLQGKPTWPLFPAFASDGETALEQHLSRDRIRKIIKRYGQQVGIQVDGITQADGQKRRGIGVHSIRKSVATYALQKGADIRDVQQLLGHERIGTTEVYTVNTGEEARRAASYLDFQ